MTGKDEVVSALKEVVDPHTNQDVYGMGLIEDIQVNDGEATLVFRPSSPFCPLGVQLAQAIKDKVEGMEGINKARVTVKGHVQEEQITQKLCE